MSIYFQKEICKIFWKRREAGTARSLKKDRAGSLGNLADRRKDLTVEEVLKDSVIKRKI